MVGIGLVGVVVVSWFSIDLVMMVVVLEVGLCDKNRFIGVLVVFFKLFCSEIDWDYLIEL